MLHARQPVSALLAARADTLRLEVYDPAPSAPCDRVAAETEESGRGLALVGALAAYWGVVLHTARAGKSVWCDMR